MTAPPRLPDRYAGPALIGIGGMAEVYRATDRVLARPVAVKVLAARLAADGGHRRRFDREARAAARLRSPHVVAVYDVGEADGRPFMVMELLTGGSLAERLAGGPVSVQEAIDWISQAAVGIDAAHAAGVVHRDVTPGNLMRAADGTVKVVDFGIARVLGGDVSATITAPGTALGTAGYLAPEQARGERGGPQSDVYALATVAYELLTGARPFARGSAPAELAARLHEAPPTASARNPRLPAEVDAALASALAMAPERRPASAGALARRLQRALSSSAASGATAVVAAGGTRGTATARTAPEVRRSPRRRRAVAGAAAAVSAGALAAGAVALMMGGGGGDAGAPAAREDARPAVTTTTSRARAASAAPRPASDPPTVTSTERPRGRGAGAGKALGAGKAAGAGRKKAPSLDRARRMTDRAWTEIRRGRPDRAVRLMERAVPALSGSGDAYEGEAYYNLGRGLLDLGACEAAVPHLEAALEQPGSAAQLSERAVMLRRARSCAG